MDLVVRVDQYLTTKEPGETVLESDYPNEPGAFLELEREQR